MTREILVLGAMFCFTACGPVLHLSADAASHGPGAAPNGDAGASGVNGDGATAASQPGDAQADGDGGVAAPHQHDGGGVHDGGGPSGQDGGTVCTSNTYWVPRDHHGAEMRPGETCIECHYTMSTVLQIGGTVYPSLHEPNDCLGAPGGMQVILTDPMGRQVTLPVNAVGNFYLPQASAIATPFTAKVIRGAAERAMLAPITDGNCNSCHTQEGAMSAPGRILMP